MGKYDIIVDEMEAKLRPPTIGLKPYEAKVIPLTTGEDMLVREATDEEIETLVDGLRIIEEAFRPGTSDGSTNPHDDELVRKVLEAQAILAESAGAVPAGPDLRNIPDEEAASADPKLMDVRLRLLARFDDVRRRRLLLVEAMRDAAAVLQKYRREGVIETAAAQAVLAKAKRAASAARTVQSPDV